MGKLTKKQTRIIGDAFIEYLQSKDLLKTWPKPELRKIYNQDFRQEKTDLPYKTSFSSVLYNLSRCFPVKAYIKHEVVTFTTSANHLNRTACQNHQAGECAVKCLSQRHNRMCERDKEEDDCCLCSTPTWIFRCCKSKSIDSERKIIYKYLRDCKKNNTLLDSELVKLSIDSANLESQPGHVNCDLKLQSSFIIKIENISGSSLHLKKCLFLRQTPYMLLSDPLKCTSKDAKTGVSMPPNSTYNVTVSCTATKQVGSYTGELFFRFADPNDGNKLILIVRYIHFFKSDDIVDLLKSTSPYKPLKKSNVEENVGIWKGIKVEYNKSVNKLVLSRPLPPCWVPRKVKAAFKRGVFLSPDDDRQVPPSSSAETQMTELLSSELEPSNYAAKFSLMIEIEEEQAEIDIRHYDLSRVTVEPRPNSSFALAVPGLAEKRPSILKGDKVYLRKILGPELFDTSEFEGYVHRIERDYVILRFHSQFEQTFSRDLRFNVRFTVPRLPIMLQHRAVKTLASGPLKHLLFPNLDSDQMLSESRLVPYNRKVGENERQRTAVLSIMHGTSRIPYIIYGPPGTGKTMTMVEAIKQVVLQQHKRVLICAPSNSACDLMVQRLYKGAKHNGHIEKKDIFRMHAFSRNWNEVPEEIKVVSNHNTQGGLYYPSKEKLMNYKVIATTLVTAGRLSSAELGHFDFVFVDEAGHAVEPECLIAVDGLLGETGRLVLAGDPQQLGPVLRSYAAKEFGLETSYLERLMRDVEAYQQDESERYNHHVITKLLKNYRSHEDILKISNECFYDGELEVCADPALTHQFFTWEELPARGFPVIFHGVRGKDEREENSPSYFNTEEASIVHKYLKLLDEKRNNKVSGSDIGIISPYRKQVEKLRKMLEPNKKQKKSPWNYIKPKDVKIGSVEEFQGQERRVILISTVRSNSEFLIEDEFYRLGFLNNHKRFNVAITRAIGLLIVVGNPEILSRDYYWNRFIQHCCDNRSYVGIPFVPSSDRIVDDKADDLTRRMKSLHLRDLLPGDLTSGLQSHVEPPHVDKI